MISIVGDLSVSKDEVSRRTPVTCEELHTNTCTDLDGFNILQRPEMQEKRKGSTLCVKAA